MPKKVLVVVEGYLPNDVDDPQPEHPIYIPVVPPPDTGLSPEHPIYIPVEPPPEAVNLPAPTPGHPIYIPVPPPPDSGLAPEHPIYLPVPPPTVGHPIVLPPYVDNTLPGEAQREEAKEALKAFLFGNLPPAPGHVEPV